VRLPDFAGTTTFRWTLAIAGAFVCAPPMVDLVIGYSETNASRLLKFLLSKVDELKFRVSGNDSR
jgi:hypothetical protein